ncbi:LysR family transcriptional regulator [Actinomadura sp. WMMB 499]|uniref:LysR family transcriptional regulator n=1 Tax=Actinomadura sp. WMMB 499 TaxID=1219491 RepID=UPI00124409B1|nr:LysR family transcriptional regulator [Actinomadura sp. WMMB 499]QFG26535.1 LysR family transcriptional regulator [Actinomadura sp. WMMB 499]
MIDRRLETLRVLRERGTVTATAEALHLTPSTVSQQLRQLARDLGVDLLEAQGRRVRLTAAAHTVLRHADALAAQWERARADLAAHRTGAAGRIRFCSVSSALAALVAPAAARLRAEHPGLEVRMSERESEEAAHLLLSRRFDIAVVIPSAGTPAPGDARFDVRPLLDEPQDLLVAAGHPLAARGTARLDEAAGEPWIGSPDRTDQHQLMLASCAAAGFAPRIVHEAYEWFSVSALVAHGFGVGLVPRLAPLPPDHAVVRVPLRGESVPYRRIVACVRRGGDGQPPIARGLAALRAAAGA